MIYLRSWRKCQAAVVKKVEWQRQDRVKKGEAGPETLTNPLSINTVSVASVLDDHFAAFAVMVGGKLAETYLVRVLQYVANGHALTGEIPVSPSKFGTLVLSREWDIVSVARGKRVYMALIKSGIACSSCSSSGGSSGGSLPILSLPDPTLPDPPTQTDGALRVGVNGKPLTERQIVTVVAILERLCGGAGGVAVQQNALAWRKVNRKGNLDDGVARELMDRWGAQFAKSIAKALQAAALWRRWSNGDD